MKTWLEDNWLNRLDRMFKIDHFTETLTKLEDDGVPKNPTNLTPDNVESFKKLWREYFKIHINIPDKPTPNEPTAGKLSDHVYHNFVERIRELNGRIAARPKAEESGAARAFFENLVECAISMYLSDAHEQIKATRKCNLDYLEEDRKRGTYDPKRYSYLENEEDYIDKWYTPLRDRLETLKGEVLEKRVQLISANEFTKGEYSTLLGFHFDVRNIKNASEFIVNIIPENAFANNRLISKNPEDLKKEFGCTTFTNSLKATEDGFSHGTYTEVKYCSKEFIRDFQENVFSLVKEHFVPLSEELYKMFKKHAPQQGYCPAFEKTGAPAIEALRVGTFTDKAFSNDLGGKVTIANGQIAATHKDTFMSPREFKQAWKWWYKADVLYIYTEEGGAARYCLPIQVKYKEFNSNVKIDDKEVDTLLRKHLCDDSDISNSARLVALLLLGGDYILTVDSWKKWTYLPFTTKAVQFEKRDKAGDNKEVKIDLNVAGWNMTLRVPKSTHSTSTARLVME